MPRATVPAATDTEQTIRRARPPFAMVPEDLLDAELTDRAVRLYALLDRYAGTVEGAWPSRPTLAARLRCSVDSVDRAIAELLAAGWLVLLEARGHLGRTNRYGLADRPQPVDNPGDDAPLELRPLRTGAAPPSAPVRPKREEVNERTPLPPTGSADGAPGSKPTTPRAAGTNPRARARARDEARAAALDRQAAAARRLEAVNAARRAGDLCPPCAGVGWLPAPADTLEAAAEVLHRCPDCSGSGVRLDP